LVQARLISCYPSERMSVEVNCSGYPLEGNNKTLPQGQAECDKVDYSGHGKGLSWHKNVALVPFGDRTRDSVFDLGMVSQLMVGKYRNMIFGQTLMKDAISLQLYSLLMERLRPGTIFDLGTCGGGSALWFASQANALGLKDTCVLTCDIQDVRTKECKAQMSEASNIEFVLGDLTNGAELFKRARNQGLSLPKPWLIAEDCHLDAEIILSCFDGELAVGDYIVFEDTHPVHPDDTHMTAENMSNYVYGNFAVEKYDLVEKAMLKRGDEWMVDASIQDMYGYNGATFINGILKKVR